MRWLKHTATSGDWFLKNLLSRSGALQPPQRRLRGLASDAVAEDI
jgi:hypothetical protein